MTSGSRLKNANGINTKPVMKPIFHLFPSSKIFNVIQQLRLPLQPVIFPSVPRLIVVANPIIIPPIRAAIISYVSQYIIYF